ncbi:MAG: 3'-5' exonuclease [Verrucomicrobiales bacterium]
MATLIPPLNSLRGNMMPGERRFAKRLETLLEDDYLCWYDVPVGHARLRPDFVILHPSRGLLVLEVKDWKLETFKSIDKFRVEIFANGAVKTVANPLEQARQYAIQVVHQLSEDPQLRTSSGPYQGKLCMPWGYGVVLTNITRKQLDDTLSEEQQDLVLPGRLVICKDEMLESTDALDFQERLWGMFHYAYRHKLSLPQIERVRWHLFPEIRITTTQRELFAPSDAAVVHEESPARTIPDLIRVFDLQQELVARNLGSGHRVIHGVAGSGKTLILGYRCAQLAEALTKPILVLCYNITLAAGLRSFVRQRGLEAKVNVHHFHEWCGQQLLSYHVDWDRKAPEAWKVKVKSVIAAVDQGQIPRAQYGAVMIDEGHDFEPEWLRLVSQMVDPATDSLLLLYDDAQSIYRNRCGLNFTLSSVGIKAAGRTTILRKNYRNTREILSYAFDFAKDILDPHSADDDHIPLIHPESSGGSGARPAFRQCKGLTDEIDYAVRCIATWKARGDFLGEIAVLYTQKFHGRLIADKLAASQIPYLLMTDRSDKNDFDPARNHVNILSAQSSKGLEFGTVIVLGIGQLETANQRGEDNAKLLYVSMTRAKERLLLTASCKTDFTERLAALASAELAAA